MGKTFILISGRFEQTYWLLGLFIVLGMAFLLRKSLQRRNILLKTHFREDNLRRMNLPLKLQLTGFRYIFWLISIGLCFVGMANWQWAGSKKEVEVTSMDIVFALDISRSMLVSDISPDRLTRSVNFLSNLLKELKANHRVGLVFFAGSAHIFSPLTSDLSAVNSLLTQAHPDLMSDQGTSLGDAIEKSFQVFNDKSSGSRSIVLVTDGEDHDNYSKAQLSKLRDKGISLYLVGVGTPLGGIVPFGQAPESERIVSKLDLANLKRIQKQIGGHLYLIGSEDDEQIARQIRSKIEQSKGTKITVEIPGQYRSTYHYWVFVALIGYLIYLWGPLDSSKKP